MSGFDPFWVPEAPGHPGLYANLTEPASGKLNELPDAGTVIIGHARKFQTEALCADWCAKNPTPLFEPREHQYQDR